jgi:O-antigen/teichoic acid export membrane protein
MGSIIGLITTIVVSNKLGAKAAGYYFLAISIVMVFSALGRVGTDSTILRFVGVAGKNYEDTSINSTLRAALIIAGLTSFLGSLLLAILSNIIAINIFDKPELGSILRTISPTVLFISLFTVFAMTLQGLQKTTQSVAISNIFTNLFVICFVLVSHEASITQVTIFYNISCFVTVILGVFYVKNFLFVRKKSNIAWREFFNSCLPLWIGVMMLQSSQLAGQIITGIFNDTDDVAMLAVAQKTAALVSFILVVVNLVVAPRYALLYKQEKYAELNELALFSIRMMLTIAIPIILLTLTYPAEIMKLFGPEFSDGKHLLQILVLGQSVNVFTGSVGYLLSMSGNEKDLRNSLLISTPLTLFLCLVLTPVHGVTGAAISTAIGFSFQSLIPAFWVYKRLGINIFLFWKK